MAFDQLDLVSVEDMHVSIANFGMVTSADKDKLTRALVAGVEDCPTPTIRLAGGCALEFPGDESVWIKVDGDVDALALIARKVTGSVERLGFFVDRRRFRPWVRLGTITDTTTEEYLTALMAALDSHQSEEWPIEGISLMKRSFHREGPASEEIELIPFQPR